MQQNPSLESTYTPIKTGLCIMVLFFGSLISWSVFAPIEGAVVAQGQIDVSSQTKVIQHLEGGIIKKILIKDGDIVQAGQELIHLSDIHIMSAQEILQQKLFALGVKQERLMAERDFQEILVFSDSLKDEGVISGEKSATMEDELSYFNNRRKMIVNQMNILQQRIEQSQEEIKGINEQLNALKVRHEISAEELLHFSTLAKNGVIQKNKLLPIRKEIAAIEGNMGEYSASIARIKQRIAETKIEIVNLRNNFVSNAVNEWKEVKQSIIELQEKILAQQDILSRSIIVSPQDGVVNNLEFHTIGGVIAPSKKIMDIVPMNDPLVINARASVQDINQILASQNNPQNIVLSEDNIKGIKAKARISAFSSRKVGLIDVVVISVSPDAISDPYSNFKYYLIKASIPNKTLDMLPSALYPGMPVDLFISTQSSSLINYLLNPLVATFSKSFKEE